MPYGPSHCARPRLYRCRRQADFDTIEMVECATPLAVDAAMAFTNDDHVEIAGGVFFVLVHQGL